MRLKSRLLIVLLSVILIVSSCRSHTDNTTNNDAPGVTPVITETKPSKTGVPSSEENSKENDSSATKGPDRIPDGLFADNFVALNNSDGTAGIYEIDVLTPFHTTRKWGADHPHWTSDLSFSSRNWRIDDGIDRVSQWFMGDGFNCYLSPSEEDNAQLVRYDPPVGTLEKLTETLHVIPLSDIPNWDEIPIESKRGELDPSISVACVELDGNVFPREACFEPGADPYFPREYNRIKLIGLAGCYIDKIPLCGTMSMFGTAAGICEYPGLLGPTVGAYSTLYSLTMGPVRNQDCAVMILRSKDFSIRSNVRENAIIKSIDECLPGIYEALDYFPNYSLSNIQIYAAELVYMPLSEYDISTHDFPDSGHTYLVPVWNLYFRYGEKRGFCCLTVDAITGKSLYSDKYKMNDPRFEPADEEMGN